jgi:hypothetical protein
MVEFIGRQIEVGIGKETTRGTALANPSRWLRNTKADFMARAEIVNDDTTQGSLSDSVGSRVTKKWFDGDLSGIVHADTLGFYLINIYGTVSRTTLSGSVGRSTFTLAENITHPTLSVFVKDGAHQKVHNSGVVNTLEITASTDDYVRYTANIIAKDEASNASSPSYSTEYDFIGKDITIKTASSEAGLAGASAIKIKNVSIKYDTGAISDFNFGSQNPDIYNAKMSIEGTFEKNMVDTTYKDLFQANTAVYMQIMIEGEAVLAGSNKPSYKLVMNKVQVTDWNRQGDADGLVTETVTFKAFLNQADAKQSTAELVNVTTY